MAPTRRCRNTKKASPKVKSSPKGSPKENPKAAALHKDHPIICDETKLRSKGPQGFAEITGKKLLAELKDAPSKLALADWQVIAGTPTYQLDRAVELGKDEAQQGLEEWKKGYKAQQRAFSADKKKHDEEMRDELNLAIVDKKSLDPKFALGLPPIPESLSDISEEEGRRPVRWFSRDVIGESDIRTPIASHTNSIPKDGSGAEITMKCLCDPFDDDLRVKGDEVFALLQCVRFEGNPVQQTVRCTQALAWANLPYPLCSVSFLEQFVKPLFEADEGAECEYCREKFGFREFAVEKRDASDQGRWALSFVMARRILTVVAAIEQEWQVLFKRAGEERTRFGTNGARDLRSKWFRSGWPEYVADSPRRTFEICRAVYSGLRETVHGEGKEHGYCDFWRFCREVALMRAERRMEEELEVKPILATDLPEPFMPELFDRHAAAESLLSMLQVPVA